MESTASAANGASQHDVDAWIEQLKKLEKMDEHSVQHLCEMARTLFDAESNVLCPFALRLALPHILLGLSSC
jgi:hypothetical protein